MDEVNTGTEIANLGEVGCAEFCVDVSPKAWSSVQDCSDCLVMERSTGAISDATGTVILMPPPRTPESHTTAPAPSMGVAGPDGDCGDYCKHVPPAVWQMVSACQKCTFAQLVRGIVVILS